MTFLALDFETGGIGLRERAPVTLGLAIFENGEVIQSKEWLFKPIRNWKGELRFRYSEDAALIHGKSLLHMDTEGLDATRVYEEVLEFLGGAWTHPIVSHNAPFDGEVWGNFMFSLRRYDPDLMLSIPPREVLAGPWFCTRRLASTRLSVPGDVANFRLDTLAKAFGLGEQGTVHGAVADAILAGRVFVALGAGE